MAAASLMADRNGRVPVLPAGVLLIALTAIALPRTGDGGQRLAEWTEGPVVVRRFQTDREEVVADLLGERPMEGCSDSKSYAAATSTFIFRPASFTNA